MSDADVLIVGAGVAGSTAAIGLARQGLRVLLVDRSALPRHKVCGCSLNREAVGILDRLGLTETLMRAGARPIGQIDIRCHQQSIQLSSQGGVAISRYALDAVLHDAAVEAGCTLRDQTTAKVTALRDDLAEPISVSCSMPGAQSPELIRAKVMLVADGLAGSCMSSVEHPKRITDRDSLRGYGTRLHSTQHHHPAGRVVMHCGSGGYVGTVVLEDGSLDIASAMKPSWVKTHRGPAAAAQAIITQSDNGFANLEDASWQATAPLTGSRDRLWMRRVFFLGDSAGYVEPFTGEGMAWAMRSAIALQPLARRAVQHWDDRFGCDWQRVYRRDMKRRQWRCKLFAKALRRPWLIASSIRVASVLPIHARQRVAGLCLPPMFHSPHGPSPTELNPT